MPDKTKYAYNKFWYDIVWKNHPIANPQAWPHWKILGQFTHGVSLEIGSGINPKIPVKGNYFIEISREAVNKLKVLGGKVYESDIMEKFPFSAKKFNLICTFEVLEHIPNDVFVLKEIVRTLKDSGVCIISVPLHMRFWNDYDEVVGHVRRYEARELQKLFSECGLEIVSYAGINIPWPNVITGRLFGFFTKKFPMVISKLGRMADTLPDAAIRQPIFLQTWGKDSYKNLASYTTGFFILRKK